MRTNPVSACIGASHLHEVEVDMDFTPKFEKLENDLQMNRKELVYAEHFVHVEST